MEDDGDDRDDSKRKSRNLSEKKRRDQFNSLVNDLSSLISTSSRKMDKSTVLQSTIAYLKHHNEATDRSKVFEIQQDWKPTFLTNDEFTHLMLESLDGFIIVFSSTGAIFYASESITSLLGYVPADLLTMSIFDLAYELDHESLLKAFLNPKPVIEPLQTDINSSNQISFYIHIKRGGIDKLDANAYELVKFVGYFRNDVSIDSLPNNHTNPPAWILKAHPTMKPDRKLIFVGTGRIQTPQLIREMSSIDPTRNEFTSKHSMEWKFLFLDQRAPPIIGYMPFEVLGTSGYDYYHFDDLDNIVACHEELMQKGESKSCYYRFLTKGQQWIWLQTDFFISYHQFSAKPDYVVCTHKVVSYADVIQQSKPTCKDNQPPNVTPTATNSIKLDTVTVDDYQGPSNKTAQAIVDTDVKQNVTNSAITNEPSNKIWGTTNSIAANTTNLKLSRPSSSYGNISSTGVSPTVKRKRYMNNNRGNDSDSTSMSAESTTSKHSLMTHMSSMRQRHCLTQQQTNHFITHQQDSNCVTTQIPHQPPQIAKTFHHSYHQTHSKHQSQAQAHSLPSTQHQTLQKIIPIQPQHPIATTSMVTNSTCQYTQSNFPALSSTQLVAPTFLEPPQYLTAIPVQPVIAPFPVTPVISQISTQQEMLPGAVVMTQTHSQLQEQLQRKHDELQKLILQQQDELRMVSEQLLLARYTLLQPMVPVTSYNTTSLSATPIAATNRNFNFNSTTNNNPTESQFNQFNYGLTTEQISNPSEHQHLIQQQQQQHQQQHRAHQLQHQSHLTQHYSQQSHLSPSHQQQTGSHQHQQQQLHQQQQQQNFLQRNVPELDHFVQEDIDVFLSLSPLQAMAASQNAINSISVHPNQTDNGLNASENVQSPLSQSYINSNPNTVATNNEDSLLSYMQMAADSSPVLNFQIGISDEGSETHSEDTKFIPQLTDQAQHQQTQTQQHQSQNSTYFGPNPFQSLNNQAPSTNPGSNNLPTELEILPYQMSQAQSQSLFNSPPSNAGGQ